MTYTPEQMRAQANEIDHIYSLHNQRCAAMLREGAAAIERAAELEKALKAVVALIDESKGVTGLHLNGDIAPWDELRTGGRFEEWLLDFDAALAQGKSHE